MKQNLNNTPYNRFQMQEGKKRRRSYLPTLMLLASVMGAAVSADAKQVAFSYSNPEDQTCFVGTSKAELYDVAITLSDPKLNGAKITGVEIPVAAIPEVSEYTVWLTKALALEADPDTGKKVNLPDICSVAGEASGGMLRVNFPEPYLLGDDPIYVGYSFKVSEVGREETDPARYPVAVTAGYTEGALMMHTQRHYLKWGDRGEDLGGKSSIKVILDGDFPAADASLAAVRDVKMQGGEKILLPLSFRSYSAEPISTMEFTYTYQGKTNRVEQKFDTPLTPLFGMPVSFNLEVANDYELGVGNVTVTLDKVNGVANVNADNSAEFNLSLLRLLPKKRPVVEEYTGLWCGWCPRGYVGMETMSAEEPDFIGIAFHNDDPMAVTSTYPSAVAGFPSCYIDREGSAKSPSVSSLRKYWGERSVSYTPVEISVVADRNGDDIEVKSTYSFVEAPANDCRIAYILLANGLTDPKWEQKNYFSTRYEANMEMFYGQPSEMTGLVYNDVAAMFSPFDGVEGSIPAASDIEAYKALEHQYVFATKGAVSSTGYDLIGGANGNLSVVALVVDSATGEVLNAAKAKVGGSGVYDMAVSPARVVKEVYYDLAGVEHLQPRRGMYVKYVFYEDGTCKAEKNLIR